MEAARSRRMRLLLYASGVERPARGVPAMARAGPRVPAMGLQQRPKLDTQTYEMEKVQKFPRRDRPHSPTHARGAATEPYLHSRNLVSYW